MPAWFTRARHPELGVTVLPRDAVESCPGWEAFGDAWTDPEGLRAAVASELAASAEAAAEAERTAAAAKSAKRPTAAPATAPDPTPDAQTRTDTPLEQ